MKDFRATYFKLYFLLSLFVPHFGYGEVELSSSEKDGACQLALARSKSAETVASLKSSSSVLWLEAQVKGNSITQLFKNISPPDGYAGSIVAAQTRANPNYYRHWIRDAALVVEAMETHATHLLSPQERNIRNKIISEILNYFDFSEKVQNLPTLTGLGEPLVNVDGTVVLESWGRPQLDGPALRASSMMQLFKLLESEPFDKKVGGVLSDSEIQSLKMQMYNLKDPLHSPIKKDLDFIAENWSKVGYDLWEDTQGIHFYTLMVQRKALLDGAEFASAMGDQTGVVEHYQKQARLIEKMIKEFFIDPDKKLIIATKPGTAVFGYDKKFSNMDMSVILGLLHGNRDDGFLSFTDPVVLSTLIYFETIFKEIYPINQVLGIPGVAFGRFQEDSFAGGGARRQGNPWVLTTLAAAETYYRMASEMIRSEPNPTENKLNEFVRLILKGDSFVDRVKRHAHVDGSTNEQIDRYSGYMTSVEVLAWNIAAELTTYDARIQAMENLELIVSSSQKNNLNATH